MTEIDTAKAQEFVDTAKQALNSANGTKESFDKRIADIKSNKLLLLFSGELNTEVQNLLKDADLKVAEVSKTVEKMYSLLKLPGVREALKKSPEAQKVIGDIQRVISDIKREITAANKSGVLSAENKSNMDSLLQKLTRFSSQISLDKNEGMTVASN